MMLPRVLADMPISQSLEKALADKVTLLPWNSQDPEIQGILTYGHPRVDGPLMDQFPHLKVISNFGVGVDHIDLEAARTRGIPVGNTPGILDGATADMAFTLLLASARRLVEGDRYARSPQFTRYDPSFMLGREVHHSTLGIIGMGRIGLQVARRARGFDMKILYHNRQPRPEAEQQTGARWVSKNDLLQQSNFVVLTVPLTESTRHLIGWNELCLMKPTAILVNVARGPVIDTEALTEALRVRKIDGAALDVTDPEPLPRDHPILRLDNLTLAPHLGSATEETRQRMADLSIANLLAGLAGQPLVHEVQR
ncbi:MAG: 2-hydroxyacid dehydrogenase [Gemmataceae bacterium]